jgi:ribonuclease P protein component
MIAQKNRLKKEDFEPIFKEGEKFSNKFFNIRIRGNNLGYCRFAVIVSNKISKKAVVRNKIRRRLKAIFLLNLDNFNQDFDILVTALPAIIELNFSEIKENFLNLAKKRQIL